MFRPSMLHLKSYSVLNTYNKFIINHTHHIHYNANLNTGAVAPVFKFALYYIWCV